MERQRQRAVLSILCALNLALAACSETQPEPLTAYEPTNNLGDIVLVAIIKVGLSLNLLRSGLKLQVMV